MRKRFVLFGMALALTLGLAITAFAGDQKTLTGVVSDSMCGAKHASANSAECARKCAASGSGYALVVGDQVYKLQGAKDELTKYAGESVTVTGDVEGDTVKVASVKPAGKPS